MRPLSPSFLACLLATLGLLWGGPVRAAPGTVTLPLSEWETLREQGLPDDRIPPPPEAVLHQRRVVSGSFDRGVFRGDLQMSFLVPPGQNHVRVPILDSEATLLEVSLDGRSTSALPDGGFYTVGVDAPGQHRVAVRFLQGREDDRFGRRIALRLPPGGQAAVQVTVPETDIEASLTGGVVSERAEGARSTTLRLDLDAGGAFELTWRRQVSHDAASAVRLTSQVHTLFSLEEALVRGVTVVDYSVLEGETDRVELVVPGGVEVVEITGDAVLQWQAGAGGDGRLSVLLRHLVDDAAQVRLHFQFPADLDAPVTLRMPLPADGVPYRGALGVQGPAGLAVSTDSVTGAEALTLRDLPVQLTNLTQSPLLMGYRFEGEPLLKLALKRHGEVELTSTIADSIGASTVLIADGTEITKMRMRLRNNTRQYLGVSLPEGAVLTHALIDGLPVRPAVTEGGGTLLFPLPQSERIDAAGRAYTVRPGDTLSGIASAFYGDPADWRRLMEANPGQLGDVSDLAPGQVLRVPPDSATVRESSFVVELAYKRSGSKLSWMGRRAFTLPAVDVDVVEATWHLYLPEAVEPVSFDANLTQYSGLRYDPVRRAMQFLKQALGGGNAWAGEYQSILSRRKAIYTSENFYRQGGQEVLSSFPLVGERYRFERLLLGRDVPRISFRFVDRDLVGPLRWLAFVAAFGLTLLAARAGRSRLLATSGLLTLLVLAHFILGVHRRILWGIDAALLISLLQGSGPRLVAALRGLPLGPRALLDRLSWKGTLAAFALLMAFFIVLNMPLLLSTGLLATLLFARRWTR